MTRYRDDDRHGGVIPRPLTDSWPGLSLANSTCAWPARGAEDCDPSLAVGIAVKDPGTKIPYLVGFVPGTSTLRWKRSLFPEGSFFTLDGGGTDFEARDGEHVYLLYRSAEAERDDPSYVRAIAVADGSTQWETAVGDDPFRGMAVTQQWIYVHKFFSVFMLDRATGEVVGH